MVDQDFNRLKKETVKREYAFDSDHYITVYRKADKKIVLQRSFKNLKDAQIIAKHVCDRLPADLRDQFLLIVE